MIVVALVATLAAAPVAPTTPGVDDPGALARALRRLPQRPSIEETQQAALRRAPIARRTIRRWIGRARAAAVLPGVSAQLDLRTDSAWQLDQEAGTADTLSSDTGNVTGVRVRGTWDLDRLVFNLDELRAVRSALDLLDWRESLLVRVTQLYFERQRLLLELEVAPNAPVAELVARRVRLAEVSALLHALTGLRFASTPTPAGGDAGNAAR